MLTKACFIILYSLLAYNLFFEQKKYKPFIIVAFFCIFQLFVLGIVTAVTTEINLLQFFIPFLEVFAIFYIPDALNNLETAEINSKKAKFFIAILVFALVMYILCSGMFDSYNSGSASSVCKVCGRSFEAGDSAGNFRNIARTGFCKNCYNNYKSVEEFIK